MTGLPRLAFVHDWLVTWGGGEQVLEKAVETLGPAPIHTLIYEPEVFSGSPIGEQRIVTSFLQRLPGSSRNHRRYLPLMPLAVEQFDLRDYPVVFSSCHAVSHGVLLRADQLHVNYVHSPMRYSWHLYHQYLQESGLTRGVRSWVARGLLHYLRLWDFQAAQRPDHVLANSHWTARNIWRAYRRQAKVIYPPVDTDAYHPLAPRDDYYLTVSRLVPYKRIGLILEAFREFTETAAGELLIPARPRSPSPQNMCFSGFMPVVEAFHRGSRLGLCLDTGAATTVLFPPFYRHHRGAIDARAGLRVARVEGVGRSRTVRVRILDEFAFRAGGRDLTLRKVMVQTEASHADSRSFHGILGVDILSQCSRMTLNFVSMSFILE